MKKTDKTKALTKDLKMVEVSEALMEIIRRKGLVKIPYSELSRKAGVSRAWIYKYFGKDPEALIEFAVDHFGRIFSRLDEIQTEYRHGEWMGDILRNTDKLIEYTREYPWFLPIYFQFRGTQSVLGKRIASLEKSYLNKASKRLKNSFGFSDEDAYSFSEFAMVMRLGFGFRCGLIRDEQKFKKEKARILAMTDLVLKAMDIGIEAPKPLKPRRI